MISPKEKTRSPIATAAWLTLLGPPSRWTVHHIAAAACTLKLRWHAFWFPGFSWHLVLESILSSWHFVREDSDPVSPVFSRLVISEDGSHSHFVPLERPTSKEGPEPQLTN